MRKKVAEWLHSEAGRDWAAKRYIFFENPDQKEVHADDEDDSKV